MALGVYDAETDGASEHLELHSWFMNRNHDGLARLRGRNRQVTPQPSVLSSQGKTMAHTRPTSSVPVLEAKRDILRIVKSILPIIVWSGVATNWARGLRGKPYLCRAT